MNAVVTPARKVGTKAAPKRQRTAVQRIESGPAWEQLAKAVSLDLADAAAQITALADSAGSGADPLPSIGTLLDEARRHLDEIQTSLAARPLLQQITDDAYTALFKPLALVEGAAALTAGIDVDVISPALHAVHEKLDEAQSNLSDQVLGKMLPTLPETEFTPEAVKDAFENIADLLSRAAKTDESYQLSGDSDRLLRMAFELADASFDRPPSLANIDSVAFNIAALVRGSRLVPGDTESPERKALIDQAETSLDWLSENQNTCTPDAERPAARVAKGVCALTSETPELASTAWYRAREAQEVVHACVTSYQGPETIWGVHTVLKVAVDTLGGMVLERQLTQDGCEDASNLLAQAIALASMIAQTVNGKPWEMLFDASLALMALAKDTLDQHREALGYA